MQRHVRKQDLEREPHLVWNAFVDLIATEDYKRMSPVQRIAHLAFWYDAEVQNGGHYQYFENWEGRRVAETITALRNLGLLAHASVLELAASRWNSVEREPSGSVDEFCAAALDGEFNDFDHDYHACVPTIERALQQFLAIHQDDFVIVDQTA